MNNKVVLLNSGGADSYASALLLKSAGYEVNSLFIDYGQPNAKVEEGSARLLHDEFLHTSSTFDVRRIDFTPSYETRDVYEGTSYADQEIFLRNHVFLSLAAQVAYTNQYSNIAMGYTSFYANTVYVDDSPSLLQDVYKLNLHHFNIRTLFPVAGYDKEMIYSLLLDHDIDPAALPYCNTPTANSRACGVCDKCKTTALTLQAMKEERSKREQSR